MNSEKPFLKSSNMCKWHGQQLAIYNLNLVVEAGEIVALMGPNGAGKSSLINILATLAGFDRGTLEFNGRNLSNNRDYVRKHTGIVSHESMLYGGLTVRENLSFVAGLFGIDEIDARVRDVSELLGLNKFESKQVSSLSNGMRKRTSIARSILHQPNLLLLDEAETGLDADGVDILKNLIMEHKSAKKTVIMVSHNKAIIDTVCSRLVVLEAGYKIRDEKIAIND